MTQWGKALAKFSDLSLTPKTHMVEEPQHPQGILQPLQACLGMSPAQSMPGHVPPRKVERQDVMKDGLNAIVSYINI